MPIRRMIEDLESRFRVEECSFNSIFGTFEGHRIYASRKVAEKIEKPTPFTADSKVSDRTMTIACLLFARCTASFYNEWCINNVKRYLDEIVANYCFTVLSNVF